MAVNTQILKEHTRLFGAGKGIQSPQVLDLCRRHNGELARDIQVDIHSLFNSTAVKEALNLDPSKKAIYKIDVDDQGIITIQQGKIVRGTFKATSADAVQIDAFEQELITEDGRCQIHQEIINKAQAAYDRCHQEHHRSRSARPCPLRGRAKFHPMHRDHGHTTRKGQRPAPHGSGVQVISLAGPSEELTRRHRGHRAHGRPGRLISREDHDRIVALERDKAKLSEQLRAQRELERSHLQGEREKGRLRTSLARSQERGKAARRHARHLQRELERSRRTHEAARHQLEAQRRQQAPSVALVSPSEDLARKQRLAELEKQYALSQQQNTHLLELLQQTRNELARLRADHEHQIAHHEQVEQWQQAHIDELTQILRSLIANLNAKKQESSALRREIQALQGQIAQKDQDYAQLHQLYDTSCQEREQLVNELEQNRQYIQDQELRLANLSGALYDATQDIERLRIQLDLAESENEKLNKQHIKDLQKETALVALRKEHEKALAQIQSMKAGIADLRNALFEKNKRIRALEEALQQADDEIRQQDWHLQNALDEIQLLDSSLKEKEQIEAQLRHEIAALLAQRDSLIAEKEHYRTKMLEAQESLRQFRIAHSGETAALGQRIQQLNQALQTKQENETNLSREIEALKRENQELRQRLVTESFNAQKEKARLANITKSLKAENAHLRARLEQEEVTHREQLSRLRAAKAQSDKLAADRLQEIEALRDQLALAAAKLEELRAQYQKGLENAAKNLIAVITSYEAKLKALQNANADAAAALRAELNQARVALEVAKKEYAEKLKEQQAVIEKLNLINEQLKRAVASIAIKLRESHEREKAIEAERNELQQHIDAAHEDLEAARKKAASLESQLKQGENAFLRKQLEQLSTVLRDLQLDYDQLLRAKQAKETELAQEKAKNRELAEKLASAEAKAKINEELAARLRDRNAQLEMALDKAEADKFDAITQLKKKIRDQDEQIAQLNAQLQDLLRTSNEIEKHLHEQIAELKRKNEALEKENATLRAGVKEHQKRDTIASRALKKLEKDIEKIEEDKSRAQQEIERLKKELENIKQVGTDKQSEKQERLTKELAGLQAYIAQLHEEYGQRLERQKNLLVQRNEEIARLKQMQMKKADDAAQRTLTREAQTQTESLRPSMSDSETETDSSTPPTSPSPSPSPSLPFSSDEDDDRPLDDLGDEEDFADELEKVVASYNISEDDYVLLRSNLDALLTAGATSRSARVNRKIQQMRKLREPSAPINARVRHMSQLRLESARGLQKQAKSSVTSLLPDFEASNPKFMNFIIQLKAKKSQLKACLKVLTSTDPRISQKQKNDAFEILINILCPREKREKVYKPAAIRKGSKIVGTLKPMPQISKYDYTCPDWIAKFTAYYDLLTKHIAMLERQRADAEHTGLAALGKKGEQPSAQDDLAKYKQQLESLKPWKSLVENLLLGVAQKMWPKTVEEPAGAGVIT